MSSTLRTTLYVDGFNLYYGAARHTQLKWVNVTALAEAALPGIQITQTRYFTALVKAEQRNPQQNLRQQMYIRALKTIPNLTVHLGRFQKKPKWAPLVVPPPDTIQIWHTEEKGSDVNIATWMLADAFRDECDQLVLITNDSDLAEPIRIINSELKKHVIVLNPHSADTVARASARCGRTIIHCPSKLLGKVARRVKDISSNGNNCHMTQAQFPDSILDKHGKITKPQAWV